MSEDPVTPPEPSFDHPRRHIRARMDQMEATLIEAFRKSAARIESPLVIVDAELLLKAKEITGVEQGEALVAVALRTLIEHEASCSNRSEQDAAQH
jgi:hypothetical protein